MLYKGNSPYKTWLPFQRSVIESMLLHFNVHETHFKFFLKKTSHDSADKGWDMKDNIPEELVQFLEHQGEYQDCRWIVLF